MTKSTEAFVSIKVLLSSTTAKSFIVDELSLPFKVFNIESLNDPVINNKERQTINLTINL